MSEIFLLCEYPTLNGGERSMLATLDGLHTAGFTPVVIAPPEGPLADELAARGVELLPFRCRVGQAVPDSHVGQAVPDMPIVRHSLTYDKDLLRGRLEQLLARRRPALLHANSLAMERLSGPAAARLVPPDDPPALAAAMLELLDDEPLQLRLSAAARRRAESIFGARTAANNLLKHYHAVAER